MLEQTDHFDLLNRYVFSGQLIMQTAFHIGGGKGMLSTSDNPVILTPGGQPVIPGSSFKGALRSIVEKLVPVLPEGAALFTCGLIELSDQELERQKKSSQRLCSTQRQREIKAQRQRYPAQEKEILASARANLCHTCRLFGSPFAASHINVTDLSLIDAGWASVIQRRDGVAIDRDSEKARDHLKYDFEVVQASTAFKLHITMENATRRDLQLISIGLSEFVNGFATIGGKRSRGLGVCLLEGLQVAALELEGVEASVRNRRLRNYLLKREFSQHLSGEDFLNEHINNVFDETLYP